MTNFMFAKMPAAEELISKCAYPSTADVFAGLIGDEYKNLVRTIFALRRGPVRYNRGQTILIEGDASEYIFLVISGVVRSLKSFQNGTRSIVTFYLPTEFFGLTNHSTHLLTAEAAADASILFFKRSTLVSLANRESRVANFLLTLSLTELRRTQEHSLLIGKDAKCRFASFLIDLSKRTRSQSWLDLPMSHQDIADHLGLTIETVSRAITQMENSGVIERGRSHRDLILKNHSALSRMAN